MRSTVYMIVYFLLEIVGLGGFILLRQWRFRTEILNVWWLRKRFIKEKSGPKIWILEQTILGFEPLNTRSQGEYNVLLLF